MEIVGIDFGTTNIRISVWDRAIRVQVCLNPESSGGLDSHICLCRALQRQLDGSISLIVGEAADELDDDSNTVVIRDIKRWAQVSDSQGIPHNDSYGGNGQFSS